MKYERKITMSKAKVKSRKDNLGRALQTGESQRSADGMYIYTYRDVYGNRRYTYSSDLMRLREKKKVLLEDIRAGIDVYASKDCTLNDAFDRYMKNKYKLRNTTRANYEYMYDHFVRETFGKLKVSTIKYSDVQSFYLELLNDREIQINTLDTIHTILHPTFDMLVRDDLIRKNPADKVMADLKKRDGKNKGVRHALTLEQQRAFLGFVESSPEYYHWLTIFRFLLGTGCRIGEALGMRWKDINFKSEYVDVNHCLVYYYNRKTKITRFMITEPKTEKGTRLIPMLPEVRETLLEEYERQKRDGFCKDTVDGMSGFIFSNRFGNVMNLHAVNSAIGRIRENYNAIELVNAQKEQREPVILPYFSCHHLRHTFCTRLCETEMNIKVIQEIMGHASIETTLDIYAEVNYAKKKSSFENFAANVRIF